MHGLLKTSAKQTGPALQMPGAWEARQKLLESALYIDLSAPGFDVTENSAAGTIRVRVMSIVSCSKGLPKHARCAAFKYHQVIMSNTTSCWRSVSEDESKSVLKGYIYI